MGEQNIHPSSDERQVRSFTRALLEDVEALEFMLKEGLIEQGVRRIGAEQELFLVDEDMGPALAAEEVLEELEDPRFTHELGLFNIEANLNPRPFRGRALKEMEDETRELLEQARRAAARHNKRVLLCGILPTIRQADLDLEAMTKSPRYLELNRALLERRGDRFRLHIKGLDELYAVHDNLMFEACNTSFQVHFQVGAEEFPRAYNLAQAVTGPVLAAAANSPVFLQHRLWAETRVALFQQSLDLRSPSQQAREVHQRVSFGERWVKDSVLEVLKDDIARFRVLLSTDCGPSSLALLKQGELPPLKALCLHNGTVYRWNRPCYGCQGGKAHLRIENRVLPAGPSVVDEVANAAFFFGLMVALDKKYGDITQVMAFDDAKGNFTAAARYGLLAQFQWIKGRSWPARKLILDELLPLARAGLAEREVAEEDIARYLGIIEERTRSGRTGAQWALDSLAGLDTCGSPDERYRTLTACMLQNQREERPVHKWSPASRDGEVSWLDSFRRVEQVMTTDLFSVNPEDLIDLAATMMDWEHIRHVPVEDHEGKLVGLVTHRQILRLVGRGLHAGAAPVAVEKVMKKEIISVGPRTGILEAMELMSSRKVGCLPVVDGEGRLMGIVTERDFIPVAAQLLKEKLEQSARLGREEEPL